MNIQPFAAWAAVAGTGVVAAVFGVFRARTALRRRARRLHYLKLAHEQRGAVALQGPVVRAIPPELVASISTDAKEAASRVATQAEPAASNPHPARTREYVLWEATFHSALSDFTDLAEDRKADERRAAAP